VKTKDGVGSRTDSADEVIRDLAGRLLASQEVERARIARELHDGVCQDVAAIGVDLTYLRHHRGDLSSSDVHSILCALERRTAGVAESLRRLSHGLHPSVLQQVGFIAALQAHCAEVERRHHIHVVFIADDDVEPRSRSAALSLFRIAQEALRNAATHGHARRAQVVVTRSNAELTLSIRDDGRGFTPMSAHQNNGLGLLSIDERARLMRGQLRIRSRPGRGTTVTVTVPLAAVDADDDSPCQAGLGSSSAA
jgi:two-component system sensor histidine kinase UhpB